MRVTKLDRYQQLKTFPNVVEPSCKDLLAAPSAYAGRWCADFFRRSGALVLEVGCGWGDYALHLARQRPAGNILGLDIKGARLWRGAEIALREGLQNLGFIRVSAEFLERLFAPGELDSIWITFPTPYLWKPDKMLIAPPFLARYRHLLQKAGTIHMKTDVEPLADYARRIWPLFGFDLLLDQTLIDEQDPLKPQTAISNFESRAVQSKKRIWHIQATPSDRLPSPLPEDCSRRPWDLVYPKP